MGYLQEHTTAEGSASADAPLYIQLMSSHLKKVADDGGLAFLAYLLSMVVEEAGREGNSRDSAQHQDAPASAVKSTTPADRDDVQAGRKGRARAEPGERRRA